MKRNVYADNAATTKLNKDAFEAMIPWLTDEYGNASQPYSFARKPKKALAEARAIIADCINASPDEIFFTSGGTESDNWAINGAAFASQGRNTIITSSIEHHAVLKTCQSLQKFGYRIKLLDVTSNGIVLPSHLEEIIDDDTQLVSVMLANNEIGTIQQLKELVDIAHSKGAPFHTDAVQAVGHIPIDVKKLNIDILSASAHKFNGPKGVGFLYIKNGVEINSYSTGGAQENGSRAGTENVAGIIGMAVALKHNVEHMEAAAKKLCILESKLINGLLAENIDFVRNGINQIPGNISLSFKGITGEILLHRLDLLGIIVSTGSACDGVSNQITHVIRAISLNREYAIGTIRISLSDANTEDDIQAIINALKKIMLG